MQSVFKMDDDITCLDCHKKESDSSLLATCQYCFNCAHFKCRGLRGNARSRAQIKFFCSDKCSALYERVMNIQRDHTALVKDISAQLSGQLNKIVENVVSDQLRQVRKDMRQELKTVTSAVEHSQDFLSSKFDTIASDFKDLKSENEQLKREMGSLKRSHCSLSEVVHALESNVDNTNKSAVSNNAIVFGMPSSPNENVNDLINQTFVCIGAVLPPDAIMSVSRLYAKNFNNNKNPNLTIPIRVTFKDSVYKDMVILKKQEYGPLQPSAIYDTFQNYSNITIRDELTPLMMGLLKEMRELQPILNIKYVWTGRGGVILVKKNDGATVEKITNRNDLNRIKSLFAKRELLPKIPNSAERSNSLNNNESDDDDDSDDVVDDENDEDDEEQESISSITNQNNKRQKKQKQVV